MTYGAMSTWSPNYPWFCVQPCISSLPSPGFPSFLWFHSLKNPCSVEPKFSHFVCWDTWDRNVFLQELYPGVTTEAKLKTVDPGWYLDSEADLTTPLRLPACRPPATPNPHTHTPATYKSLGLLPIENFGSEQSLSFPQKTPPQGREGLENSALHKLKGWAGVRDQIFS